MEQQTTLPIWLATLPWAGAERPSVRSLPAKLDSDISIKEEKRKRQGTKEALKEARSCLAKMGSLGNYCPAPPCPLSNDVLLVCIPTEPKPEWAATVEARYPGLHVRWVSRDLYIDRDVLVDKTLDIPPEYFEGVTIVMSFLPPRPEFMKDVRFVQLTSAGADKWVKHEKYNDPDVMFCTANGIHATQISEWVIGTWLMAQHSLLKGHELMVKERWAASDAFPHIQDSPGLRMGVLGYGAIGRQCARVANAMGMEIYAYTRTQRSNPDARKDDSYHTPGTGDPDGLIPARWFHGAGRQAVNEFLAQDLDILVISTPLTKATHNLLGREQFDILSRQRTFVCNIARGAIVDTDALVEALDKGKIRGAALDVTEPEPLPESHPLWSAPNVYITPHVSWITPRYWDRLLTILEVNLARLSEGRPLLNLMNRKEHY